ncbi:MAG: carbohydrate-binding domain-containing protein, partial [Bacilli bacterium]|nr:carbohydrate-binding domain-containing protein [Bacilli bacterium]
TLENEETGVGDVTISGGDITILSADDGVHADRYLNISGGTINVTESYEGLEGNQITVSGGETYVYASDDGVNAGAGIGLTPLLTQTGGLLFAAVPTSGDVDGIDSNGNLVISGGTMIACGPTSSMGACAVDTDGSITVSGSATTLLVFGGSEATPSYGSTITKSSKSSTFSSGKAYTITYSSGSVTTGKLIAGYSSVTSYSGLGSISSVAAA